LRKYTAIPAITGKQLAKVLVKDGWEIKRRGKHGLSMAKRFRDRVRVTVIPYSNESLDSGTLGAILGPKQTNLRMKGLLDLINKYGI